MTEREVEVSDKSYAASVCLCMIFGVLGVHHFYIGNILHGLFDLCLFVVGFGLILLSEDPILMLIGLALIIIDVIHSFVVTILLFVGKVKDGEGKLIAYPGQV